MGGDREEPHLLAEDLAQVSPGLDELLDAVQLGVNSCMQQTKGGIPSLVPRPPHSFFFAAVEKNAFSTAAKKAVREGLGTRLGIPVILQYYTSSKVIFPDGDYKKSVINCRRFVKRAKYKLPMGWETSLSVCMSTCLSVCLSIYLHV